MKILLIVIFILIAIVCWPFGTSTNVNGKYTFPAFVIRSIFYWMAVSLAFMVGLFVG